MRITTSPFRPLLLGAALCAASLAPAQWINAVGPTSIATCDPFTMSVDGTMPCANQVFLSSNSQLLGTALLLQLFFEQPIICLPAILPFAENVEVAALPPGTYTVTTFYYINGELFETYEGTLTVTSPVDVSVLQDDGTLSVTPAAQAVQWLNCDVNMLPIPGATDTTFTPLENGNYAASISMNGCTDTTECVMVLTVGLPPEQTLPSVRVTPNPAAGMVFIGTADGDAALFQLSDAMGRVVLPRFRIPPGGASVDLSTLPAGAYVLQDLVGGHAPARVVLR